MMILLFVVLIWLRIVIVRVVFFLGLVLVFSLFKSIRELVVICFKICLMFFMWLEKVDRFCFNDCLFLMLVKMLLKMVIVEFLLVGINIFDWVINWIKFRVFKVIVFLLVFGFVIMIVW